MFFLFRGKTGLAARAVIGAALIIIGLAVHGEAILVGLGVVLILWAGVLVLRAHRVSRQDQDASGSRLL